MSRVLRVTSRNANFQQWSALLSNRAKRQKAGEALIQGVRPITLAVDHGFEVRTLIYSDRSGLSGWAREMIERTGATRVPMSPDLVAELAGKDDAEMLAVVAVPPPPPALPAVPDLLAVVFDRPSSPGNVGMLIRSADAFGATAVVITGHAADPWDPQSVRASTGSIFAVPVLNAGSHRDVLDQVAALRAGGLPVTVAGTDEHGAADLSEHDLTGPYVVVIGNETHGLSAGWREACDVMLRIPITGAATSLNAAAAATVVLYEARRQRRLTAG